MAKPYKKATSNSIILSIVAAAGVLAGLLLQNALWTILLLLPTVSYEVYRTEGKSTKWASWGLLAVYVIELMLIFFNVSYNLVEFFGTTEKEIGGYLVPLGDVKVVGPTIMAVLAIVLFIRTRGRYTRWLAAIIFITSFAIIYILDPAVFQNILKFGVGEVLKQSSF